VSVIDPEAKKRRYQPTEERIAYVRQAALERKDARAKDWLYPVDPEELAHDLTWLEETEWPEERPFAYPSATFQRRVAAILTLMAAGMPLSRIAKRFKVKEDRVTWYLDKARQKGLIFPNRTPAEVLDDFMTPMALETLLFHLGRKDKATAIKHLEGRGLYQVHQAIKHTGDGAAAAFKVEFSTPEGGHTTLQAGQVLGTPRPPDEGT